jgi:hypothetical protein
MTAEQESKVRNCLALLEEAQGLVNVAAGELCSVPGSFAKEWGRLCKLYDSIKQQWYRIETCLQRATRQRLTSVFHDDATLLAKGDQR